MKTCWRDRKRDDYVSFEAAGGKSWRERSLHEENSMEETRPGQKCGGHVGGSDVMETGGRWVKHMEGRNDCGGRTVPSPWPCPSFFLFSPLSFISFLFCSRLCAITAHLPRHKNIADDVTILCQSRQMQRPVPGGRRSKHTLSWGANQLKATSFGQ